MTQGVYPTWIWENIGNILHTTELQNAGIGDFAQLNCWEYHSSACDSMVDLETMQPNLEANMMEGWMCIENERVYGLIGMDQGEPMNQFEFMEKAVNSAHMGSSPASSCVCFVPRVGAIAITSDYDSLIRCVIGAPTGLQMPTCSQFCENPADVLDQWNLHTIDIRYVSPSGETSASDLRGRPSDRPEMLGMCIEGGGFMQQGTQTVFAWQAIAVPGVPDAGETLSTTEYVDLITGEHFMVSCNPQE